MTDTNTAVVEPQVDTTQVDNTDWKAEAEQARAESAKVSGQKKKLLEEIANIKKTVRTAGTSDSGEDYKTLYQQETAARAGLMDKVKSQSIATAAQARLLKAGVLPDAIDAATSLLDRNLVEWSEDDGVDETSLNAAVAKLKNKHGFMFEKKVASTKVVTPADGKSTGNEKEISRSDFDALSPLTKSERIRAGWKVV